MSSVSDVSTKQTYTHHVSLWGAMAVRSPKAPGFTFVMSSWEHVYRAMCKTRYSHSHLTLGLER